MLSHTATYLPAVGQMHVVDHMHVPYSICAEVGGLATGGGVPCWCGFRRASAPLLASPRQLPSETPQLLETGPLRKSTTHPCPRHKHITFLRLTATSTDCGACLQIDVQPQRVRGEAVHPQRHRQPSTAVAESSIGCHRRACCKPGPIRVPSQPPHQRSGLAFSCAT